MAQTITAENPIKRIDAADSYLTLNEGTHIIYLVTPIFGGLVKFDQIWLLGSDGKPFPVQSFASEEGFDSNTDPATVFVQRPENKQYVKNPNTKPQTQYRMIVAIEKNGKFELKVLNLKKALAEAFTSLVTPNEQLGGALLDNNDCVGTKIMVTVTKSGRKAFGYDIMEYKANPVPQKSKPDFSDLIEQLDELNIEDGLGGKTPQEVVERINQRGIPFDFQVVTK